jgi:hypothetical protein
MGEMGRLAGSLAPPLIENRNEFMSATDFKRQLAACADQRAVERLLQSWFAVAAVGTERAALRDEVCNKVCELKK